MLRCVDGWTCGHENTFQDDKIRLKRRQNPPIHSTNEKYFVVEFACYNRIHINDASVYQKSSKFSHANTIL